MPPLVIFLLLVVWTIGAQILAQPAPPKLAGAELGPQLFQLSCPKAASGYRLEAADSISDATAWSSLDPAPTLNGEQYTVTLPMQGASRYFRLRLVGTEFRVVSLMPADGASEVGVTVRPQV